MKHVSSVMQKHVVGVERSAKVSTALMVMRNARVSVAPVLEDGVLIGLLKRETAIGKGSSEKRVDDVMLRITPLVYQDMNLDEAAQVLVKSGFSRLPVVESKQSRRVVGTVTATALVRAIKSP